MASRKQLDPMPPDSPQDVMRDPLAGLSTQLAAGIALSAPAMSLLQALAGSAQHDHPDPAAFDELDHLRLIRPGETGPVVTEAGEACLKRGPKGTS